MGKPLPQPLRRTYRADGSKQTQPTRASKRHASRKAGKAAKTARKANR